MTHMAPTRIPFRLAGSFTLLAIAVLLNACGPLTAGGLTGSDPGKETIYALDGVKMISTSVTTSDDSRTYGQRTYTISPTDRLLMRFESLSSASLKILSDKPVRIRVFAASDADLTQAMTSLRVCPILKNWMMGATWDTAHPFKGGGWTPGGEIELDDCVAPETEVTATNPPSASPAPATGSGAPTSAFAGSPCMDPGAICFDVSAWYNNYVVQRSMNYGVALISYDGKAVRIYGDGAGSKGPRIHWTESTAYP